ncbi:hypothetical protein RM52_11860 [Microbacterium hominis]|uniref:Uncharacterized protein n=1 Tax=Microbacterium hominis TaxID=162426 RepID=A0A0B4DRQ2_9MICO|nr:hypothetical protein RM52_11860 [Microbacterium hominis]
MIGAEPAGSAGLVADVDDLTYAALHLMFPDPDLQAFALYGHSKNMERVGPALLVAARLGRGEVVASPRAELVEHGQQAARDSQELSLTRSFDGR